MLFIRIIIHTIITSFVDTSHAISVDDASCPFTKHFISDFVHLYLLLQKKWNEFNEMQMRNGCKRVDIIFMNNSNIPFEKLCFFEGTFYIFLPVVNVYNCQHKPFSWLKFVLNTMLVTFPFDFHWCENQTVANKMGGISDTFWSLETEVEKMNKL